MIVRRAFGAGPGGQPVELFELRSADGIRARLCTLGATLVGLDLPDRDGHLADCVLGFDDADSYLSQRNQHFGCVVGRVANRIAEASFELDGETWQLPANVGRHHLHGGPEGLHRAVWSVEPDEATDSLRFSHRSPDGDQGYPGNLDLLVDYRLDGDELSIDFEAVCDAPTPVNLTNHAYWNLAGHDSGSVLDHQLTLAASRYAVPDDELILTGAIEALPAELDFHRPKPIGRDLPALLDSPAGGYDHSYLCDGRPGQLREVALLSDPHSGRRMQLATTAASLQLYSGNSLFGQAGKGGRRYPRHSAVCLEAQSLPNAPRLPHFPSVVLRPGETYRQRTCHRFFAD